MMANEALDRALSGLREILKPGTSLADMRAGFDGAAAPVAPDVSLTPVTVGGRPAEWIAPPNAGDAVVLFLHGGGYVIGSIVSHRDLAARIGRAAAARVLLIDYRLAPEHPYPAAVEDAVAAYRDLLGQGIRPAQIAIAGDSAGGGLALATLLALRDGGDPLPAAAVTLSAWSDLAITGDSIVSRADVDPFVAADGLKGMAGAYLNGREAHDPLASPLYGDFRGLPPLLMQVGTAEVLHDDTVRVAERARAAGVAVTLDVAPDMIHVYQAFAAIVPEGARAIERIGGFLRARLGG